MNLSDYSNYDALGLGELVRSREVSASELEALARLAIIKMNGTVNAVIGDVDSSQASDPRSDGPFTGVPFLLKDLGHGYAGVPCDMGSRLGARLLARRPTAPRHAALGHSQSGWVAVGPRR